MTRNTPSNKNYWSGKGPNPRARCETCGLYMYSTSTKVMIEGKRTTVGCGKVCKNGHFVPDKKGLNKIPD